MTTTTKCVRCGALVRVDRSSCPACGAIHTASGADAAPSAPASSTAPRREDADTRIRARVMWGDALPEIRDEQIKQGLKPVDVDGMIRRAVEDRKHYYRRLGKKNISVGIGLLFLGSIIILWVQLFMQGGIGRMPLWFFAGSVIVPVAGILAIAKGVRRLQRPGEGESMAEGAEEGE